MFIAFEGPDNVGKSTTAANLAWDNVALYNATKSMHEANQEVEKDLVMTYDRIDWFSHMVYRLALPDREWNDERVRTVFAMPDTHLVVFTHHPQLADFKADEIVDTPIAKVNPMYFYFGDYFMLLNEQMDYSLFKTVSLIEVINDPNENLYKWNMYRFSSPALNEDEVLSRFDNRPESLVELLRYEEQHRL